MNLFNVLDGFFEGIVFFIYNVCRTSITILTSPFRGPVRLLKAHRSKQRRQISSQTALMLATFALITVGSPRDGLLTPVPMPAIPTSSQLPSLDALWPFLATAGFMTIAVDVSLRLLLLTRFRNNSIRRKTALAVVEYSMTGPWLALFAVLILYTALYSRDIPSLLVGPAAYLTVGLLLLAIVFYGVIAPSLLLARCVGPRAFSLRPRSPGVALSLCVAISCLAVLPATVSLILFAGRQVFTNIAEARRAEAAHPLLAVAGLQCVQTAEGRLHVRVTLSNPTDQPVSLHSSKVNAVIGYYGTGTEHDTFDYYDDRAGFLASSKVPTDLVTIAPKELLTLDGDTVGLGRALRQGDLCSVRLVDSPVRLKGAYFPHTGASELKYVRIEEALGSVVRYGQLCNGDSMYGSPSEPELPLLKGHKCVE